MAGVNPRSLNVIHAYKNINVFLMKKRAGTEWQLFMESFVAVSLHANKGERTHNIREKKGQCAENTGGLSRSEI